MKRKIYSAEEFLKAVKDETIFLCFPFFDNEFRQHWNAEWEKYVLQKYDEALTPTRELTERELNDGDVRCPNGMYWHIVVGDVALDFFHIIFKKYYRLPSFELFYHYSFYLIKDWGDFKYTYSFWCSMKWQNTLRKIYDKYKTKYNSPEAWISLWGEVGLLFTYES